MDYDKLSGKEIWDKVKNTFISNQVFWENEVRTNVYVAKIMVAQAIILLICLGLDLVGIFSINQSLMTSVCLYGFLELIIPAILCFALKGEKRWLKYIMVLELMIVLARLDSVLTYNVSYLMILPVILSCCYYSHYFTMQVSSITTITFAISTFCGAYFKMGILDMNYKLAIDGSYDCRPIRERRSSSFIYDDFKNPVRTSY